MVSLFPIRLARWGRLGAMHEVLLVLHNLLRWFVLAFGLWALLRPEARPGAFFAHTLTLQVVLGVVLAFASPLVQGALLALDEVMRAGGEPRYFVAEHWVGGSSPSAWPTRGFPRPAREGAGPGPSSPWPFSSSSSPSPGSGPFLGFSRGAQPPEEKRRGRPREPGGFLGTGFGLPGNPRGRGSERRGAACPPGPAPRAQGPHGARIGVP